MHLLITKYGNTYLNKLLAVILLHRAFQMLYFILATTGKFLFIESWFVYFDFIYFAYPASAYLYVRGFIKDESEFALKDYFHFIPALILVLNSLLDYMSGNSIKEYVISKFDATTSLYTIGNYGNFSHASSSLVHSGLIVIYLFFIWRIVLQSGIIKNSTNNLAAINWVLILVSVMTLSNLTFLVLSVIKIARGTVYSSYLFTNYGSVLFCVLVVSIITFVFYNPKILYGYVFVSKEYSGVEKNMALMTIISEDNIDPIIRKIVKTKKNTITSSLVYNEQLYLEKITAYMEIQKPYLNANFSISILSQETSIAVHHCSYIINYLIKKNFRDWVNEYRITYFIQHYFINSQSKTILALASESGFKNKATFYNAFLNEKGTTPKNYFISIK